MNKQLIMALMTGTHRCAYSDDATGICSRCGKMHSPHNFVDAVCTVCKMVCSDHHWSGTGACSICGTKCAHGETADLLDDFQHSCLTCSCAVDHSYSGGVCRECGHVCGHSSGLIEYNQTTHYCRTCRMHYDHSWSETEGWIGCAKCSVCGAIKMHTCPDATATRCGLCQECGYDCGSHEWSISTGTCQTCGYTCAHKTVNADTGRCTVCGYIVTHDDATYYILDGAYAGSYVRSGAINGQAYYRQYVWNNSSASWQQGSLFLVELDITEPTSFGGEYAYEASGMVFTTNIASFPINSTLTEGDGKYNVTLRQYTLDGDFIAEKSYTSSDCADLTGNLS